MIRYRAIVKTKDNDFGFPVIGQVEHRDLIESDVMNRVEEDPNNQAENVTKIDVSTLVPYDLVIFDADGTLTPLRPGTCGEFKQALLPNVSHFVFELHEIGVRVGVASNQGLERQLSDIVDQMTWTREALHITPNLATFAQGGHRCKPAPNMLQELMLVAGVEPEQTLFVGDQDGDKEAAKAAGVEFIYAEEFFGW